MRKIRSAPLKTGLLATFILTLSACGGPNHIKIGTEGGGSPDTKESDKVIATAEDQTRLAFSELEWNLNALRLAVHPPTAASKVNCASYKPTPKFPIFLTVTYGCSWLSDASDSKTGRRFDLAGAVEFSESGDAFSVNADHLVSRIAKIAGPVTAQGEIQRTLKIRKPAGSSHSFPVNSAAKYTSVLVITKGEPIERWSADFNGAFDLSGTQGFVLVSGSTTKISAASTVTLTARSEIRFIANGNCLRPVGTFAVAAGEGDDVPETAIISTPTGYSKSDEPGKSYPWGSRCLEH